MSSLPARSGWGNVYLLSATVSINLAFVFSWGRIIPLELRQMGAGDFEVSLAFATFTLAQGLGQYPGGLLSRRFGKRNLIVASTLASGIGFLLAALAMTWPAFVLGIFIQSFLGVLQMPAFMEMMAQSVDPERRGQAFGILHFFIGAALVVGPALGAWLMPLWGFSNLVLATALALFVLGLVRLALVETPEVEGAGFHWRQLLQGELLALTLVGIMVMSIQFLTLYGPFIPLLARDAIGLTPSQINLLFALGALAAMLASPVAGKITSKWGGRRSLMAGGGGHLLLTILWTRSEGFWTPAALFVLSYVMFQLMIVAYDTLRITRAASYAAGPVIGATGTISTAASAAATPLGGLALAQFGQTGPYWVAGVMGLVLYFALLRMGRGIQPVLGNRS